MKEKKAGENSKFNDKNAKSDHDGKDGNLQKSAFENDFEKLLSDKKLSNFRQILKSLFNR